MAFDIGFWQRGNKSARLWDWVGRKIGWFHLLVRRGFPRMFNGNPSLRMVFILVIWKVWRQLGFRGFTTLMGGSFFR